MRTLVLLGVLALAMGATAISFDDLVKAADEVDHPQPVEKEDEEDQSSREDDPEMQEWSTDHLLGFDEPAPTHMFDNLKAAEPAAPAPEPKAAPAREAVAVEAPAPKSVEVVKKVVKKVVQKAAPQPTQKTVSSIDDLEALAEEEEHPTPVKKAIKKVAKKVVVKKVKKKVVHMVSAHAMLHAASSDAGYDEQTADSADAFASAFMTEDSAPSKPPVTEEVEQEEASAPAPKVRSAHKAVKKAVKHAVKHAVKKVAKAAKAPKHSAAQSLLHPITAAAEEEDKPASPTKGSDLLHPTIFESSEEVPPKATKVAKKAPKKAPKKVVTITDVDSESSLMDEPSSFEETEETTEHVPSNSLSGLAGKYLEADDSESVNQAKASKEASKKAAVEAKHQEEMRKQSLIASGGHNVELDLSNDTPLEEEDEIPEVQTSLLGGDDDDDEY